VTSLITGPYAIVLLEFRLFALHATSSAVHVEQVVARIS
jgi:hypothetical protein